MDPATGTPKSARDPDGTERKSVRSQVGEKTWGTLGREWEGAMEGRAGEA